MKKKAPWLKFYEGLTPLRYPDKTISAVVLDTAKKHPQNTALVYFGRRISYGEFADAVLTAQKGLEALGIKEGDRIMVCLPNIPQAVYLLYGADRLGAVCSFVHPLSAPLELSEYAKALDAACVFALDSMKDLFEEVTGERPLVLTNIWDEAGRIYKPQKNRKGNLKQKVYLWRKVMRQQPGIPSCSNKRTSADTAVILFSGGTTGTPKGVMLSGRSLNAMAMQTAFASGCEIEGKSMLAAMPLFHGFGLCVCVHTVLMHGGICILMPRFNGRRYAVLVKKHRPDFIAGVPTLFEALLKEPSFSKLDLSCLMGVFCGGDSLPQSLKVDFDKFLHEHKAKVKIREGYGLTECVTACCLTPLNYHKEGSVGIPFPDTYFKICKAGTIEEVPYGKQGEICISGETLMQSYLNAPLETKQVLRHHADGEMWLHTGDMGFMDEDGFVYFRRRLGRMIVSSGYNVYPEQLEALLNNHPKVEKTCVVGIKDAYRMQRIKVYIVPAYKVENTECFISEIKKYCEKNVAKYALPSEFELITKVPLTKYGKVDYGKLENIS